MPNSFLTVRPSFNAARACKVCSSQSVVSLKVVGVCSIVHGSGPVSQKFVKRRRDFLYYERRTPAPKGSITDAVFIFFSSYIWIYLSHVGISLPHIHTPTILPCRLCCTGLNPKTHMCDCDSCHRPTHSLIAHEFPLSYIISRPPHWIFP